MTFYLAATAGPILAGQVAKNIYDGERAFKSFSGRLGMNITSYLLASCTFNLLDDSEEKNIALGALAAVGSAFLFIRSCSIVGSPEKRFDTFMGRSVETGSSLVASYLTVYALSCFGIGSMEFPWLMAKGTLSALSYLF